MKQIVCPECNGDGRGHGGIGGDTRCFTCWGKGKVEKRKAPAMKQTDIPPFDALTPEQVNELLLRLKAAISRNIPPGTHFFLYVTGEGGESQAMTGANFTRAGVQVALMELLLGWSVEQAQALAAAEEARKQSGPKLALPADPKVVTL